MPAHTFDEVRFGVVIAGVSTAQYDHGGIADALGGLVENDLVHGRSDAAGQQHDGASQ